MAMATAMAMCLYVSMNELKIYTDEKTKESKAGAWGIDVDMRGRVRSRSRELLCDDGGDEGEDRVGDRKEKADDCIV